EHFLELVVHREPVLEEDRDQRPDRDAAHGLGFHGALLEIGASLLVLDEVHDLALLDLSHQTCPMRFTSSAVRAFTSLSVSSLGFSGAGGGIVFFLSSGGDVRAIPR